MPALRAFSYQSFDYDTAWALRQEVLLDPFSIDHDAARLDDARSLHFGFFEGEQCIACLFLVPREDTVIQMRQVAVAPGRQRTGLGRLLVRFAEEAVVDRGFSKVYAHARHTAVSFYLRIGYEIRGEPFQQVGIEHHLVEKVLGG